MVSFSTSEQSSEVIQKIYQTKMFSDITLVAGKDGKKIQAHKVVLGAALNYFELMFSGSYKEASDSEVKISDVDFGTLKAVIQFVYLGLVDIPDMDTAIKLLEVSHLMKITALQDHVENYMLDNIAADNCLGLVSLANKFDIQKLGLESANFAVRKFGDVLKEEEFKNLGKEEMIYYSLLLKNSINVNDWAKTILNWILSDESRRNLSCMELLQLVDITLIKEKALIIKLHSACFDSAYTKFRIDLILQLHQKNTNNRETMLIVKRNGIENKKSLFFYNIEKDEFVRKCNIMEKGEVVGVWDGKVIIINPEGDNKTVKIYNLQEHVTKIVGTYSYSTEPHKIDLKSGAFKRINSDDFLFESCELLNNRVHFLVYSQYDKCTVWVTTYDDKWKKGACIRSYGKVMGMTVVHNQLMYYYDRENFFVYNPVEDEWTGAIHLEFTKRLKFISIQNKILFIDNNTIYEHSEETLNPIKSKLNVLDWGSDLSIFPCN